MPLGLYVATRKGLLYLTRDARTRWRIERTDFLGDPVTMMLADARDGTTYAALKLGHFGPKLRRQRRGGVWEEIAMPALPDAAGATPAASVSQIWSLEAGGAPDELWAGTIPGALFRSTDAGASWQLVESLWNSPDRAQWFGGGYDEPGIHSICVDPRDARRLTIAVSCGGVWHSADGGTSWAARTQGMRAAYMPPERAFEPNIQDPHRLVQCAGDPDKVWVQHHNGIFFSPDGGHAWREIDASAPSHFGFAVAVHPRDGNTAWFVPAVKDETRVPVDGRLVVTRTRDGGASFELLQQGLPQQSAFDLIYRHGLDISADGAELAMGSTTGGLWWSGDQGDRWELVSAHLPPIYAVRFAAA